MSAIAPSTSVLTFSFVLEHPPADPGSAKSHFVSRLSVETDPSDVHADLSRGSEAFLVLDARGPDAYAACHLPGAISLPHRTISRETVATLARDQVLAVLLGPGL